MPAYFCTWGCVATISRPKSRTEHSEMLYQNATMHPTDVGARRAGKVVDNNRRMHQLRQCPRTFALGDVWRQFLAPNLARNTQRWCTKMQPCIQQTSAHVGQLN